MKLYGILCCEKHNDFTFALFRQIKYLNIFIVVKTFMINLRTFVNFCSRNVDNVTSLNLRGTTTQNCSSPIGMSYSSCWYVQFQAILG